MRQIRRPESFVVALENLLEQGLPLFGYDVIAEKRAEIERVIRMFLVHYPVRPIDPGRDIYLCCQQYAVCAPLRFHAIVW